METASVSRRELMLVSAAAGALGGGLVALAFAGGGRSQPRQHAVEEINGFRWRHSWFLYFVTALSPASSFYTAAYAAAKTFHFSREQRKDPRFYEHGSELESKGGEDVGVSRGTPTTSSNSTKPTFVQRNGCSSSKPRTSQQSQFFSVENGEVDGFEDVASVLKVGDMDLIINQPASSLPQAVTKPDPYDPSKREGYMSWDDYFMAIAFLSARRSKDPNRQVGACIVSQDRVILGIGYNGFPRGCSDDRLPWAKKSACGDPLQTKYPYVCHAEVNAILNKNQASASGQRLYVTLFPCNECAKIIIQAGIAEVVYYTDKGAHVENDSGSTEPAYVASRRLLSMAGIKVWQHQPADKLVVLEFR